MMILTLDDKTFDLSKMPDELEDDIRFSVLDNSDPQNPDFDGANCKCICAET